jgi:hypothetical protein
MRRLSRSPEGMCWGLKPFAKYLTPFTLPEIKDFNALSDTPCLKSFAKRCSGAGTNGTNRDDTKGHGTMAHGRGNLAPDLALALAVSLTSCNPPQTAAVVWP